MADDYSDLTELGIDVNAHDPLNNRFEKCVQHVRSIAGSLDSENLLKLYGFYKQSTEGPCKVPKPSWYDVKGKSKWESWNALGNLDTNEAKEKYIELVLTISPSFSFDEASNKTECWVRVSSMAVEESPIDIENITNYIRNGDVQYVTNHIKTNNSSKDALDELGMGFVHYAADIGSLKMLEALINAGCNINLQDAEGQTALHYASGCGHLECLDYLLSKGAAQNIRDGEGCTAFDVAANTTVKSRFSNRN